MGGREKSSQEESLIILMTLRVVVSFSDGGSQAKRLLFWGTVTNSLKVQALEQRARLIGIIVANVPDAPRQLWLE
jgi:hypothetical protein